MKALITGWSKWIWFAVAKGLAEKWYDVVISYFHDEDGASQAIAELRKLWVEAKAIKANSWKQNDLTRLFEKAGNLDVLINNIWSPFPDEEWMGWDVMFQYHMMGTVYATELFASQLQWQGSIVNISSVAWQNPFAWHQCVRLESYCCMKASVDMYTKLCANKFAGRIQVNVVSPGNTITPGWDGADEEFMRRRAENSCLKRFIKPEEIAQAVLALIENPWINGQVVVVDGGVVARGYE